jgi:hypothetical protein
MALAMASCSKMDDYLKYTGGKEIIYTGKVDSMRFRSGRERVVFTGLLISDPNVNKVSIYWDNKTDSIILPIERGPGIDELWVEIPLPEGPYNFQVYTADKMGHSSVVTDMVGNSYGEKYQRGLYDRPVERAMLYPTFGVIEWYNADPTSYVEVTYTDTNDMERTRIIPATKDTTVLMSMKPLSRIKMQTFFLPDPYAVDVFSLPARYIGYSTEDADVTAEYIKNAGVGDSGIKGTIVSGEFGTPSDWITAGSIVSAGGGLRGWSSRNSGVLHMENSVNNGKIYQTFTLPAGSYVFSNKANPPLSDSDAANWWGDGQVGGINAYCVVAKGAVPPDIADIRTSDNTLGWFGGDGNAWRTREWRNIEFTLNEETEVSVGFVANMSGNTQIRIKEVRLLKKGQYYE